MTSATQLKSIQKASGMTQVELASEIGVTFAALNRWLNADVVPRPAAQQRIDALYAKFVNRVASTDKDLLTSKKSFVLKGSKKSTNIVKTLIDQPDLTEQFELALTYHTNRLEGSTLTEQETALVIFENATLPDKTLVEQLEAKNHQTAIRYLLRHLNENETVDEDLILKLHSILMNGIRTDAGRYRTHGVRIVGTFVPTANPIKVPLLMAEFGKKIGRSSKDVIGYLAKTHAEFEQIHPFSDGNGRIGRLLANALALKAGYPPVLIMQSVRRDYLSALNKAQLTGDFVQLEHVFADAVLEGQNLLERK